MFRLIHILDTINDWLSLHTGLRFAVLPVDQRRSDVEILRINQLEIDE